jgi:alkanesulfonate monooxygenase SsuD/methylene tetrahydromethanopterin reductase-like flavin-dependent oxidoreductase (luciferase family)
MDPFSVLTAIAEASGRVRLVTSVLILPPRGILSAAKQYAALDVLTGGRVIAGVGRIGKSVRPGHDGQLGLEDAMPS